MSTPNLTEATSTQQDQGHAVHHADQRETSLESPADMVHPNTQQEEAAEMAISETNPSAQD